MKSWASEQAASRSHQMMMLEMRRADVLVLEKKMGIIPNLTCGEMIAHIKEHTAMFEGRTVEAYFEEYWHKYENGGIYECICSDLGIEPRR